MDAPVAAPPVIQTPKQSFDPPEFFPLEFDAQVPSHASEGRLEEAPPISAAVDGGRDGAGSSALSELGEAEASPELPPAPAPVESAPVEVAPSIPPSIPPAAANGETIPTRVEQPLPTADAEKPVALAPVSWADLAASVAISESSAPQEPSVAGAVGVTPDMVQQIAQRVIAQVSEKIVREIDWEVIPEVAEALIKREIERLKGDLQ